MRTKQVGRSKQEIFNEVLKESGGEQPPEAVTRSSAPAATGETRDDAAASASASSSGSNEVGAPRETGDAASVVES